MSYYGWSEPLVDDIPEASRPQPRNASLLRGENKHRAGFVWRSPSECKALKMRQRSTSLHWSPEYQPFLEGCRLLGVHVVLGHTPCKELVMALIERWQPETNTFHLVPGEATITLEDMEVLTGLPTTGRPLIVSPDERPVTDICEQWLGVQPPPNAIQGRTVRVSWVKRLFNRLPDGATPEVITSWAFVANVCPE
ncbi:Protein MAIN-LIKE 2 [Linum perenne]